MPIEHSKERMIIELLEVWLQQRWSTHRPTRHMVGTYGLVFVLEAKATNITPEKFCIKTINPAKWEPGDRNVTTLFEREMRLWLKVPHHSHVLPALGLEFVPVPKDMGLGLDVLPLVRMPFCETTLSACIKNERMSLPDRIISLAQICSGLQWLYAHGLQGHGDLKPDNILVSDVRRRLALPDGGDFPSKAHNWEARVADLGWADIWTQGGGTYHAWRPYLAPERYENTVVPEASDVFAVGIIACELLSGKHPAGDLTEKLAKKWNCKKWREWATSGDRHLSSLPPRLRDLVASALACDPSERPTAGELQAALCENLEQEHGLNIAAQLSLQNDYARTSDIASRVSWAAVESARVGAINLDTSIGELEGQLAGLATRTDEQSAAKWVVVSRALQTLLLRRAYPLDSGRVTALADETLDRLLLTDRGYSDLVVEVYGQGIGKLDIAPEEVVFEFAHSALTNLRKAASVGMNDAGDEAPFQKYEAFMDELASVVYKKLSGYWAQRSIELDQQGFEVLRQDGVLNRWWPSYHARKKPLQ
jgi:serine/threonine protein kinase